MIHCWNIVVNTVNLHKNVKTSLKNNDKTEITNITTTILSSKIDNCYDCI